MLTAIRNLFSPYICNCLYKKINKIQSEDLAPGNAIIEAYIQYIFMYIIYLAVVVNAG